MEILIGVLRLRLQSCYISQKVPSALQTTATGLQWFKILPDGFDGTTWGVDRLIANIGKVTLTIPARIPLGNYFLRY